ncbi:hypothetical protein MASR2M50_25100 [Thauera sp.]
MPHSKSKVDKAGQALAKGNARTEEELIELESVFNDYRKSHLQPLTELTLELQRWLTEYGAKYYIAQRLKRKPQIIRKLNRHTFGSHSSKISEAAESSWQTTVTLTVLRSFSLRNSRSPPS